MKKFYLEEPSLKRKDEIIDYINEFVHYNSDISGTGLLDKILDGYTFEEALEACLNMTHEEYAKKHGMSQAKTYLLIRALDNKIIGSINIRFVLTEEMKQFGGNIGYGIRPTERRKGYNKINLYLGLIEAKKLGLDRAMLVCEESNLASAKIIEALGGTLEKNQIDPYSGTLASVYWIDVEESIKKYHDPFKSNIL